MQQEIGIYNTAKNAAQVWADESILPTRDVSTGEIPTPLFTLK